MATVEVIEQNDIVIEVSTGAQGPKGDTGDTGPQGDPGATGGQGPQGIQGPKGDTGDAATISVGTVSTGSAGSSVTITNVGDSHAAVLNITIPRGDTGSQGPQGVKGDKGDTGDTGAAGDKYKTTSATSLTIGTGSKSLTVGTGLSYSVQQPVILANDSTHTMHGEVTSYNSGTGALVVNVLTVVGSGTFASWQVNLEGIAGIQGPTGPTGSAATISVGTVSTGSPGSSATVTNVGSSAAAVFDITIPRGDTGSQGPQGVKGDKGDTGNQGATGATGAQGNAGVDGRTVLNGAGAPTTQGVNGDFYLDTTNNRLYGPKTGGAWGSYISIIGPTGPTGATGLALTQQAFTGNGSQMAFQLTGITTNDVSQVIAILGGGAKQRGGVDYTVANGLVTFTTAPANGLAIDLIATTSGMVNPNLAIAYAIIF